VYVFLVLPSRRAWGREGVDDQIDKDKLLSGGDERNAAMMD